MSGTLCPLSSVCICTVALTKYSLSTVNLVCVCVCVCVCQWSHLLVVCVCGMCMGSVICVSQFMHECVSLCVCVFVCVCACSVFHSPRSRREVSTKKNRAPAVLRLFLISCHNRDPVWETCSNDLQDSYLQWWWILSATVRLPPLRTNCVK